MVESKVESRKSKVKSIKFVRLTDVRLKDGFIVEFKIFRSGGVVLC